MKNKDQIFNIWLISIVVLFGIIISNGTPTNDTLIVDRIMLSMKLKPWSGNFRGFHYGAIIQIVIFIFTYNLIKARGTLISKKIGDHPFLSMIVFCFVISRLYLNFQNMFI